jgi:hypothetical protein
MGPSGQLHAPAMVMHSALAHAIDAERDREIPHMAAT